MAKTICIDPGHGGFDSGATNGAVKEKDITLQICLQLKTILEAAGVNVVMTRETDVSPGGSSDQTTELQARCDIAAQANADLFLAIHVNAGGGNGAEIFVYNDGGSIHGIASGVVNAVGATMGFHGEPIKDGSDLYVIRHTTMPAMLLEIGFIDSNDLDKINANMNNFAKWIASPLIPWLEGTVPATPVSVKDYVGSPYEKAIDFVKAKGWMEGYSDDSFAPNDPITRGQLALVLQRVFDTSGKE